MVKKERIERMDLLSQQHSQENSIKQVKNNYNLTWQ